MNWKKTFPVIRREYIERMRTKGFWIATLLIPALTVAYIVVQSRFPGRPGASATIAVVDTTGRLYQPLVKEVAEQEENRKKESSSRAFPTGSFSTATVEGSLEATKETLRKRSSTRRSAATSSFPGKAREDEVEYYSTTVRDFSALDSSSAPDASGCGRR